MRAPVRATPNPAEDLLAFARGIGVDLYRWQIEAAAGLARSAGRFDHPLAGISAPRGNGKSLLGSVAGLWRLIMGPPPQRLISAALDVEGAKVVLAHAKAIIRANPEMQKQVDVQANLIHVPSTGSSWKIVSREHTASRGEHPDLIVYDECGWARDDELFASLLAGQASVADPLMLVISTVGRRQSGPLWTVKTLAEGGDPSVFWWWTGENLSPRVTRGFLKRQRRILLPGQFAREHQNVWVDHADSFTSAVEVDAAMGREDWKEQYEGTRGQNYVCFTDLGAVRDPSVVAVGHQEGGVVYIDRLVTFQGSHEAPVQLTSVEAELVKLSDCFKLSRIQVESWQGLSAVQSLQRFGLPVELFTPTAKSNSEGWPVLAQRLSSRTLVLFPHAVLREELLNLVYEVGPQGVRVIDRGKIHQDHAVAVRGVATMLATGRAPGDYGLTI